MKLVTRKQWGARSPRTAASHLAGTKGVKVHYTGSRVDPRMADDHDRCAALVRQIQNGHMDGNGWNDIGYSFCVCPHRYVFEGRGLHKLPAANGAGLNSGHYAVLGMVGNEGLTVPNDAMLHGIRDAIDHVRAKGGAGKEIKGHRDGYSTDCPGAKLYKWVKDGAPRPKGDPTPEPVPDPETAAAALTLVLDLGTEGSVTVAPGARLSIPWTVEHADPSGLHAAKSAAWLPKAADWHLVTFSAIVTGHQKGERLKLVIGEYERTGNIRLKDHFGEDKIGHGTRTEHTVSGLVWLSGDHGYRADLVNHGAESVTVASARLRIAR
ncbi:hypothetical protein EDD29_8335 [Actinocorallia herbida]|uniref:Peptidoglycan recognition protein family domain-containing protein n=1 Tax=Actinocorallia herbida TaxID=58109 RepID=A0A3N1DAP4_9ACTN|nr:hypothetical protein [Actinocorallia herbida]ROO90603.1 hypothetical protein EDD29_8335 [Actinocorallia herbida]